MGSADKAVTYRCSICHAVYSAGERFCPLDAGAIGPDDGNADPRIGRTIDGRYFIKRLVGRGGMGAVYEADHVGLDKRVAIKFLAINKTDRDTLARFRREAKVASRIVHEHVVQMFDVGTADSDTDYIVMEFLEGRDLAVALREAGTLDPDRTLSIIRKVLRGLRAIHQAGIVHRDIKPANVLLAVREDDRDFVKIMDFGISKPIEGDTITHTGAIVGTPEYMAPEQLLGEDIDARADLYAVGLMMHRMLTGRLPFTGDLFDRAAAASPYVPVPSIETVRPGLPSELVAVIAKALAKDRGERFADAQAFLAAIEGIAPSIVATPVAMLATVSAVRQPSALEAAETAENAMTPSEVPPARVASAAATAVGVAATVVAAPPPATSATVTVDVRRRRTPWWIAVVAVVLAGGAVAAVLAMRGGDQTATPPDPAAAVAPTPPAKGSAAEPVDHRRRAREAERRGDVDGAIAAYLDAYTDKPDGETAFHIAELYERQGRTADAITYFQRYLHLARDPADRDTVTARIAKLEAAAKPASSQPPSTPRTPTSGTAAPSKPQLACHCFSRDGLPDRQALCARTGPSRCHCAIPMGPKLCTEAVVKCEDGQSCDNDHRCPSATFGAFVTPGTHGAACSGYDVWSPGELTAGKLVCDVCPAEPPRQFHGPHRGACEGYYRHTGQTVAGVMDCE